MRALLSAVMVGLVTLTTSCTLFERGREELNTMPEPEYQELRQDVVEAGETGGVKLKELLDDPRDQQLAREVAMALAGAVQNDDLGNVDDVVRAVVVRFQDQLGNPQVVDVLQDATNLIDAAVGQIRLGIDGVLTEREKGLVVGLLEGVALGLQ